MGRDTSTKLAKRFNDDTFEIKDVLSAHAKGMTEANENVGTGQYKQLLVKSIFPDLDQVRDKKDFPLTLELVIEFREWRDTRRSANKGEDVGDFLVQCNNYDTSAEISKIKESLIKLVCTSSTIRSQGLHQPIKVYRKAPQYIIFLGERRWLSHHLERLEKISVIVVPEPINELEKIEGQLIENIDRSDLTSKQILKAIKRILVLVNKEGGKISARKLAKTIGLGKTQAGLYLQIASGPIDVYDFFISGQINIESAAEISSLKSKKERSNAMASLQKKQHTSPLKVGNKKAAPKIQLGSSSPEVFKNLINALSGRIPADILDEITDWGDTKKLKNTWSKIINHLEM